MRTVDLKALEQAYDEGEIRVHPDDLERLSVITEAAYLLLQGPSIRITEMTETQQKIEINPDRDEKYVLPGVYRMTPVQLIAPQIEPPEDWEEPPSWKEDRQRILEDVLLYWSFEGPLPTPTERMYNELSCLCGQQSRWLIRYWLLHDYGITTGKPWEHRFRYRCDVSMKCQACGFVGLWGVVVPDEIWHAKGYKMQRYAWTDTKEIVAQP